MRNCIRIPHCWPCCARDPVFSAFPLPKPIGPLTLEIRACHHAIHTDVTPVREIAHKDHLLFGWRLTYREEML
jgi:hypothetical protein